MNESNRPIVTFALFAFNQEKYIRQAIEGALAQTYAPLEIFFSDDCSTDLTFQIMQEMAATYCGPHLIRLNKNVTNLGIAGHINFLMTLVHSDFVVVAAGDDISHPDRTDKLTSAWLNSGRKMKSIHSYAADMNEYGELTGNLRRGTEDTKLSNPLDHAKSNIFVLGATHGWDMSLINQFKPILRSVINEDVILPARASLIGGVGFISEILVDYRIGIGLSHEITRRRVEGAYTLSVSLLKRPYYLYLQKYRDYKEYGVLAMYRVHIQQMRAEAMFPVWLKIGFFSQVKIIFFLRRCSFKYLIWESIKFKFPKLVSIKQRIQFWLSDREEKVRSQRLTVDK